MAVTENRLHQPPGSRVPPTVPPASRTAGYPECRDATRHRRSKFPWPDHKDKRRDARQSLRGRAVRGLRHCHRHVLRGIGGHVRHHLPLHLHALDRCCHKRTELPTTRSAAGSRPGATAPRAPAPANVLPPPHRSPSHGTGGCSHPPTTATGWRRFRLRRRPLCSTCSQAAPPQPIGAERPGGGVAAIKLIGEERAAQTKGRDRIDALAMHAGGAAGGLE